MTQIDYINMVVFHSNQEYQPKAVVLLKGWFSDSFDSFLVQQLFVNRINICGKNRQLLVDANR